MLLFFFLKGRSNETYLGNILRSRFSVIFFSSLSCSVLSATTASRLLAYFSIIASMLSKMLDFLRKRGGGREKIRFKSVHVLRRLFLKRNETPTFFHMTDQYLLFGVRLGCLEVAVPIPPERVEIFFSSGEFSKNLSWSLGGGAEHSCALSLAF